MKERIREIAGELLKTAAERALRGAPSYEADPGSYNGFVARFPYEETADPDRAIAAVIEDLTAGKPMHSLVCGDVGFAKPELAVRAAFVAAMQGVQVAVCCPTTHLPRPHATDFSQRFSGYPVQLR